MRLLLRLIRDALKGHVKGVATMLVIALIVSATPYAFAMLGRWLVDDVLQVSRKTVAQAQQEDEVRPEAGAAAEEADLPEAMSTPEKLRLLVVFLMVSMGIHVVVTGMSGGSELVNARTVHRMIFRFRTRVHRKLSGMDMATFSREQVGQLMTRALEDVGGMPGNITHLLVGFCTQIAMLGLGLVLLLRMNPTMTLVALGALPFYGLTCFLFLPRIRRNTEQMRTRAAALNGFVVERLSNVTTIKNYAQEGRESADFARRVDENLRLTRRQQRLNLYFNSLTTLITGVATLTVLALGFINIRNGSMQLGTVLAFHSVTAQLFVPIGALVGMTTVAQTLQVLGTRLYSVLDAPSLVVEAEDPEQPDALRGDVLFQNASLRYQEGGLFAVSGVYLSIPAGSTVCIVGPTGCGKSTVLALLTRLYDPTDGRVCIDGVDIRRMPVTGLRRAVGNVLRDCQVFSGTLAENIAYGRQDATPEEIEKVARAFGLHDFAAGLPKGYRTRVGRGGVELDAEMLARLGFARAALTHPAILTIDDTYSTVEEDVERSLRAGVRQVLAGKTVLVATSRLTTCTDADMVVVMERGGIVEKGTHTQLMATPGVYRRMYQRQMGIDLSDPEGVNEGGGG